MVFEQLYSIDWLREKPFFAFIMSLSYTIIGIVFALMFFPQDPALVAVAFTSLLLIPTLRNMYRREENVEKEEQKFSFKRLYTDNKSFIVMYLWISLGVFLSFAFFSIAMDQMAVNKLFREQVEIQYGNVGNAVSIEGISLDSEHAKSTAINPMNQSGFTTFMFGLFEAIFSNNLRILIFCFLIAFIVGDGAIFLLTWNASVWGTIFGILAKFAALNTGGNPFSYFIIIMSIVLPHAFLEILSYIIAAISGGVLSKGLLLEKTFSKKFRNILVFNLVLLIFAIITLVLAGLVETYVLGNVETYRTIIQQSFG